MQYRSAWMDLCSQNLVATGYIPSALHFYKQPLLRVGRLFADLERGRVMDILLFPFTPPAQNGQGAMQKVGGKLEREVVAGRGRVNRKP